ncbi:MAG: UDP-N-acetylglucosamine 2-epimerase (non-hydrolyzing) [Nitrospinaceae bacterium]|nr:MAG: UDP-N-acetylglucosamine 2-epimerase (non-hydrolyzing) [Nitrospinaceae bacterium]
MKILSVVGARPNFIKIAPLLDGMKREGGFISRLVHTGQHYDDSMSRVFFDQLGIPKPDHYLGVGSSAAPIQVGQIMERFLPLCREEAPDAVLVVGDVNSTLACALVGAYSEVPVIHVEAGLRSRDRGMPEEINRVLTDQLSTLLFTTEASARDNLLKEGIASASVHFVGNVMVDTLFRFRRLADENSDILNRLGVRSRHFGILTLHRPSNVDRVEVLRPLLEALGGLARRLPIVFAVHPRTEKRIAELELSSLEAPFIRVAPLPYLDMLKLMDHARLVLTDSGGIQEETTALGVPCLTLRENTERPVTVEQGTNRVVGSRADRVILEAENILSQESIPGRLPELWDGETTGRILKILRAWK